MTTDQRRTREGSAAVNEEGSSPPLKSPYSPFFPHARDPLRTPEDDRDPLTGQAPLPLRRPLLPSPPRRGGGFLVARTTHHPPPSYLFFLPPQPKRTERKRQLLKFLSRFRRGTSTYCADASCMVLYGISGIKRGKTRHSWYAVFSLFLNIPPRC